MMCSIPRASFAVKEISTDRYSVSLQVNRYCLRRQVMPTHFTILVLSIKDLKYSEVHSTGGPCGMAMGAKSLVFFMIKVCAVLQSLISIQMLCGCSKYIASSHQHKIIGCLAIKFYCWLIIDTKYQILPNNNWYCELAIK